MDNVTRRDVLKLLKRTSAVIGVGEYEAYTGAHLTWEKFFPAWLYAEDEPFVR